MVHPSETPAIVIDTDTLAPAIDPDGTIPQKGPQQALAQLDLATQRRFEGCHVLHVDTLTPLQENTWHGVRHILAASSDLAIFFPAQQAAEKAHGGRGPNWRTSFFEPTGKTPAIK